MPRCPQCAFEIKDEMDHCPQCGHRSSSVQVLTPQERESFHGITIQDEKIENGSEYKNAETGQRVYVRHIQIDSSGPTGFVVKLIFFALLMSFLFIFLPMAMLFVAAGILGWFISRLLKR